ncbi:hypothetical protein HDU85_006645 [Gaertneriomyces sp. JEL0708]|nr:hypothetical protein HDU85_006645 [Gaertneriomyces sp. JEL0708]
MTVTRMQKDTLRIFLIQSAHGLFASSGGYRANLSFCRAMAKCGHSVKMLALPFREDLELIPNWRKAGTRQFGPHSIDVFRFEYEDGHIRWLEDIEVIEEFECRLLFVHEEIAAFEPTHVLVNEPSSLKIAMDPRLPSPCVRVFIAHDAYNLPFGPYANVANSAESDTIVYPVQYRRLQEVEGLWTVSQAMCDYFVAGGLSNAHALPNHPWIYGDDPTQLPFYSNWDKEYICVINPGIEKGFHIVRDVAKLMPHRKFLATKSWSMTDLIVAELEGLPNVRLEESKVDIEELFSRIKVLIAPSVWFEAFGLVVLEAMLRGIPTISSDAGGLPEAHLNYPCIISVQHMTGEKETDPDLILNYGQWKVPRNDPRPWVATLDVLMDDKELYERVRKEGRQYALDYVQNLPNTLYEDWMRSLHRRQA